MASSTAETLKLREQDLAGKVAVITGASRGIGYAIAINLASRGCSILGTCSRPESLPLFDSLDHSVSALYEGTQHTRNSKIAGAVADIYSPTCASKIADTLESKFDSRIDIFINNAAYASAGPIGELDAEEVQRSLLANIQTPVLIVEELVRRKMFQPDSRIVYISSIRTRLPWSMQLLYSAGKSAGESLCRTWAEAFGGKDEQVSH